MDKEKEEVVLAWIEHVKNNRARMEHLSETLSAPSGFYYNRQLLAENGVEITPQELAEFRELVKATLEKIDE